MGNEMVNIAVIGIGAWGKNHVRVTKELKEFNLIGICDVSDKNLKKYQELYGVSIHRDYKEILKNDEIEAVIICTPSNTHYEVVKEALEAKKHVFVEKPLTLNSKSTKELIEIANNNNLVLMVGHIFRYNNALNYLKNLIEKKDLGRIYSKAPKDFQEAVNSKPFPSDITPIFVRG